MPSSIFAGLEEGDVICGRGGSNRAGVGRICVTLPRMRRGVLAPLAACGISIWHTTVKKKQQKLTKGQIAMTVAAVLIIASMVLGGVASVFQGY